MPFASLYADFLPPPGAVAEQNQTGTQQLVRDQSDPGAVQAPAQFIDGQKGQEGRTKSTVRKVITAVARVSPPPQGPCQDELGRLGGLHQGHQLQNAGPWLMIWGSSV